MIANSKFEIGIGIHYGEVLAGLIGASNRMEYTIIGSAVNLAARLESETRKLNSSLVVSKEFTDRLDKNEKDEFKEGQAFLKGFKDKTLVYYR